METLPITQQMTEQIGRSVLELIPRLAQPLQEQQYCLQAIAEVQ